MSCRFQEFMKIIKGDFICEVDGKRIDGKDMDTAVYTNYIVTAVEVKDSNLWIELKPFESIRPEYSPDDIWVQNHEEQFGTEPGFF